MPVQVVQLLDWEQGGEMWPLFLRTFLGPAPLQFNTTAMATVTALNEPGGTHFLPQLATPRLQQRANVLVHAAQPLDWKQSRKTGPFFVFVVDGTGDVRPKQWR